MRKITEKSLDHQLLAIGWAFVAGVACVTPFVVLTIMKYRDVSASIAENNEFVLTHDASMEILGAIGSALQVAVPICLLCTLYFGITILLNVRRRKSLVSNNKDTAGTAA